MSSAWSTLAPGHWRVDTTRRVRYELRNVDDIFNPGSDALLSVGREGGRRFVVVDECVYQHHGERIKSYFHAHGVRSRVLVFPGGEQAKTVDAWQDVLRALDAFPIHRRDEPIIAIGGGVLTDVVGFVASSYRRGVPHIKVPTTLMGYVDAAVGIKTGVNFNQRKNRLGSFEPPAAVLLDRSLLSTLAPRHLRKLARAEAEERAKDSPLRADINVKIDLGEDFQVDGMGIDTRLAGNLELTANGPLTEMPSLKGRVETVGGTFQAYGQHLNIERGRVFFSGDVSNPGLDILALRPNYTSDQQVGALVQGTALLPQVKLYSKPTLPDDQVLAWLILGHAAPEDGGEAAMMQAAALALLGGRESGGVASSLGLDELSFGGDTSEGVAGASVTLGKRLSDRLYTAYEHSLSGTGGVLLIFYDLSKRWVVRGQASESSAVDLIYRLSYD